MEDKVTEIIAILKRKKEKVATMESCTGGCLVDEITNVSGASEILEYSAVTYSNQFKVKMGVRPEIIDTYTVYSVETAKEMSRAIAEFAESAYGIGITGILDRLDPANEDHGKSQEVYFSIYDREMGVYYVDLVEVSKLRRRECKIQVVEEILDKFSVILK